MAGMHAADMKHMQRAAGLLCETFRNERTEASSLPKVCAVGLVALSSPKVAQESACAVSCSLFSTEADIAAWQEPHRVDAVD
jgi:hypothetical protein